MKHYTQDQFDKLPKWAQQEIKTLEMRQLEIENKLSQYSGEQETNTYIQEGLSKTPLPINSNVEFRVGRDGANKATVYVRSDGLIDVNTDSRLGHTMLILPRAANSFYIAFVSDKML